MLSRGFTLLEILVTLVIMMFGMLGLAGLILKGQRASYEAYQRNQALSLATDMAERLKANRLEQINSATYTTNAPLATPLGNKVMYDRLIAGTYTNCETSPCTSNQLAFYDLARWDGLLVGSSETFSGASNLIGGISNARGCIEIPANFPPNTFRVTVVWQGDASTTAPAGASTCGAAALGVTRHVVSLDVIL